MEGAQATDPTATLREAFGQVGSKFWERRFYHLSFTQVP